MKALITSILFALLGLIPAVAQTTVDAKEIIDKINRNEAVSYRNATINGDLDLTNLANRREVREGGWKDGETNEYLSTVTVPLTFKNCTFAGKFLAYRNDDQEKQKRMNHSNTVYNADFAEAVTIENCTFTNDATFKYSVFSQQTVFVNNTFKDIALFKYAKFRDAADFGGSTFSSYADFKYARFDESLIFQKAKFERYADFKYTKFAEGVDFRQTRFGDVADFKYTHLPRGTNFDEARFSGAADFKYTTLDGRKFSPTGL